MARPVRAIVAASVALQILALDAWAQDPAEMRAVYAATYDINTQAKCDAVIANVLARNVNAVFVEVRGRADAYYYPNREDSTYPNNEPRGQLYAISPLDLDVLQYFIDRLHNATPPREVHAWCTTYPTWHNAAPPGSPQHVYNAHPEWITENAAGVTYTYSDDAPLDPGIPAVQDHLVNVFADIVRNYDIDGIHFDYVRLLGADSGFDPVGKAAFLAQTGWNYDTQNPAGELTEVYRAWRRDQISKVVQRVHRLANLEKPWVEVSAFLVNFADSVEYLGQGYNWWVKNNAIDVLHPGCYSSTVSGTVSDWDFFVAKLAQNGDQLKRPMVTAVGDYLLTATEENTTAVLTLRANARPPDGYNLFDYGSVFVDSGTQHADQLFNAGRPFANWAPVPPVPHKSDEETTPPNVPASAAVVLAGGRPRITFSRPATAADGDLPVRYQLYRGASTPPQLHFANMIMEWWDPGAARASFSFDDLTVPAGNWHYSVVAYDNWNNRAVATVGPVSASASGECIIETRTGGQNPGDYSEMSGSVFADSTSHSGAPGCTPGIGSRFALPADANGRNDRARFTPTSLATGTYDVYATCYNYSSANALGITVRKADAGGVTTSTFDLTHVAAGDAWTSVATMHFVSGEGHYIEFDNSTQTNLGGSTNSRMNAAAVRFVARLTPKEAKPPVTELPGSATELIVDSTPQALDYDDVSGSSAWQTSTLTGYYEANARYYSSSNYPFDSYAVWIADLPQAGNWAIDGWVRNNTSFATGAQYRFVDGNGVVRTTAVTQRTGVDSTTTGGWFVNVDGVPDAAACYFNRGRVYVTVYGNTGGAQTVIADALRFRLIQAGVSDWRLY